ncbi:MAG: hypothetical protein MUP31_05825 [Xanthomonadales bacterium]|nr:hypothetical protein [Xanthomonadales bacterium]
MIKTLNSLEPVWRPQWLLLSLWLVFSPAHAAEPGETGSASQAAKEESNVNQDATDEESLSLLDRQKQFVDTQVQRASTWADAFFQDPNHEAEGAYSEIRIRPELYYRQEQGAEGRFRFRARFNLPNLGRKVSLVIGADEDNADIRDSADDSRDEGAIGLQFFMKESRRWNTSITAGIKFNEFAGFVGPRVRYEDVVGEKGSYRITQTLRWQTNNAWQINTRLDLNRVINDYFFFRQTFDGRWRGEKAEEEGYRTQVSSFLTQRLSPQSGLQYEFSTVFNTRPDTHVDKYVVAVRYRKQTRRDWLYYEIVPQVSFENEYGYKFNPGIRLRLEIFYGGAGAKKFWRRESEDTENFRW